MSLEHLLALSSFAFVAAVTPGPNNTMLLASGLNFGFARTVPHIVGINIGFPVMVLLIGLGVGQLFAAEPRLFTALKIIGVFYLLWLAWRIANSTPSGIEDAGSPNSRPLGFIGAAAFQWVNPKAWIIAIGALATYGIKGEPVWSALIIATVYSAVGFASSSIWAAFGTGLRRILSEPSHQRAFNVAMALILVASLWPAIADLFPRLRLG